MHLFEIVGPAERYTVHDDVREGPLTANKRHDTVSKWLDSFVVSLKKADLYPVKRVRYDLINVPSSAGGRGRDKVGGDFMSECDERTYFEGPPR